MGDEYDPSKPTKSLLYMDANSLYPTGMYLPLLVDRFDGMEHVDDFNVAKSMVKHRSISMTCSVTTR